jgi:Tol biopolymer transport system component
MGKLLRWTGFALTAAFAGRISPAQSTERASVGPNGVEGDSASGGGFLGVESVPSADGRYVFFASDATDFVSGDTNGYWDLFVRDRMAGTIERVNVDSNGQQSDGSADVGSFSGDARFLCFASAATTLVAGDTNTSTDVFVRDLQLGLTERVSLGPNGVEANSHSLSCSMSADARYVAFMSWATNLVPADTNGCKDVFVRDRLFGTTERVSVDSNGVQANFDCLLPQISGDGRFVAFESVSTNLVPGDTNLVWDIFVRDRQTGTTERVSVDSAGNEGNDRSRSPALSADGRFVAFFSFATNLVAGDTNGHEDVFVRDRLLGTTERVSVDSFGAEANGLSRNPDISADGRFVAFESLAWNLVPNDTNSAQDVFLRDRLLETTARITIDSSGVEANNNSWFPKLSADGRCVTYTSVATNLVPNDTNGLNDVFVRDRGALANTSFCMGDGTLTDCPCANNGLPGSGCDNSAGTGGALLLASGEPSLANDTLVLSSAGELDHALSVFLQGTTAITMLNFGDGLRCTGGVLHRLYIRNASAGVVGVPQAGDLSISARSAALGDVIAAGATRYYQTYYRDPSASFCPAPQGNNWNISSGTLVVWQQ